MNWFKTKKEANPNDVIYATALEIVLRAMDIKKACKWDNISGTIEFSYSNMSVKQWDEMLVILKENAPFEMFTFNIFITERVTIKLLLN